MPNNPVVRYRDAGVDIDEADRAVGAIRKLARATFTPGVLTDIGTFGASYGLAGWKNPVLVSSADGVGTKLKIAFLTGRHDTVGEDLVNHCVNDIAVQGATPLFFLDYFAVGKLDASVAAAVISGIARGCKRNVCALIGGETAEMPGLYAAGEYDLAGFIVGAAERRHLLTGRSIRAGDVLIGLPSTGLHTNGYSLARSIVFDRLKLGIDDRIPEVGTTVAEALLAPHRSYLPVVRPLLARHAIKGMAHITGGGITDNLPRVLPEGTDAVVRRGSWQVPPIFRWLQQAGSVPLDDMLRTFNMGVGLILVVAPGDVDTVVGGLSDAGEPRAVVIGEIARGDRHVRYA